MMREQRLEIVHREPYNGTHGRIIGHQLIARIQIFIAAGMLCIILHTMMNER